MLRNPQVQNLVKMQITVFRPHTFTVVVDANQLEMVPGATFDPDRPEEMIEAINDEAFFEMIAEKAADGSFGDSEFDVYQVDAVEVFESF